MRRRTALVPLLLLVLAGCSAGADRSNASAGSSKAAPASAPVRAQAAAPSLERQVVRTAQISVHVKAVSAAADKAVGIATDAGGRADSDQRTEAGDGQAVLVLRVPPAAVEKTLTSLAALGKETSRSLSDKDVTAESVDVASRVETQRTSVARVRALLARAQSLTDITRIERELTTREAELESLQNRMKALQGTVDLASVTVTLSGSAAPAGPASHAGFTDGLSGGWGALTGTARVVSVIAGALLPWSWLLVIVVVTRVAWRRWRPTAL